MIDLVSDHLPCHIPCHTSPSFTVCTGLSAVSQLLYQYSVTFALVLLISSASTRGEGEHTTIGTDLLGSTQTGKQTEQLGYVKIKIMFSPQNNFVRLIRFMN